MRLSRPKRYLSFSAQKSFAVIIRALTLASPSKFYQSGSSSPNKFGALNLEPCDRMKAKSRFSSSPLNVSKVSKNDVSSLF